MLVNGRGAFTDRGSKTTNELRVGVSRRRTVTARTTDRGQNQNSYNTVDIYFRSLVLNEKV